MIVQGGSREGKGLALCLLLREGLATELVLLDVREHLTGTANRIPGFKLLPLVRNFCCVSSGQTGLDSLLEERLDALVEVIAGHVVVDDADALDVDGEAGGGLLQTFKGSPLRFLVNVSMGIIFRADLTFGVGCRFESLTFSGS